MIKEPKRSREKLNKALDDTIENFSEATKKHTRKIFDALIEEGINTVSHIFDRYKIIVKHKVIKHEVKKEENENQNE